MQRRGKSGKPGKGQRTARPKARKVPTASASTDYSPQQFDRLKRERDEALEQQAATSEVLKVISSSPGDMRPVFEAMLANALRICEAKFGRLLLYDGVSFRGTHLHDVPPSYREFWEQHGPIRPGPNTGLARLARTKRVAHIPDLKADPAYADREPLRVITVEQAGARSLLAVPMLKENKLVGAIIIYRQEVRPFTDKQIELVKNFAAQAVIAIENTRLLNELRESLHQQTATAEVLKTISSSTGQPEPVFNAMLENAVRICGAKFGSLVLFEGNAYRRAALHNAPAAFVEAPARDPVRPLAASPILSRVAGTKQVIQFVDIAAEHPEEPIATLGGARTVLSAPMLNDDRVVGVISIYRQEVRPFTDKQVELVKNFASQAVIAIENTRLLNELRQRTDDLSESLEQQTATGEVLKAISSSFNDLKPVFDTIGQQAEKLCDAEISAISMVDGDVIRLVSINGVTEEAVEAVRHAFYPMRRNDETLTARAIRSASICHVADVLSDALYPKKDTARLSGWRGCLAVPMIRNREVLGAIFVARKRAGLFADAQVQLLRTFADQAVIAVENTRLLNELRQRTDDLSESLEQQIATSEVLSIISSSAGELQPVFKTMLAKATELCEASYGTMWLREGNAFRAGAIHGALPEAFLELHRTGTLFHAGPGAPAHEATISRQACAVADLRETRAYREGSELPVAAVDIGGVRTMVTVPMFKEDEPIGVISIYRREVRPFSDKQIDIVSNFAKQADIAIENTRLLNELRESLRQQTATLDVLNIIASSPGELEQVFEAMLANATQICGAEFGLLYRSEGDMFRTVSLYGAPPAFAEQRRVNPMLRPSPGTALGRVAATKEMVQIPDVQAEPAYQNDPLRRASFLDLAGARTVVCVPMLKDNEVVGAISIYRQQVRPFTDKQIALLTNFAAQAVIAIENVRLLNELRESLQQQTATADVLKVISRSTFDLQTVLNTLAVSAARLCEAENANIWQPKEDIYRLAASYNEYAASKDFWEGIAIEPGRGTIVGRSLLERKIVHVHDVCADPEYTFGKAQELGGFRTVLAVPMLREGVAIGVFALTRREMRPFTDKQIDLITTFADQAAIAIENVRLFNSVEARTRELAKSLDDLRTTQDRLVQTQKLASLGQLTAGIAHEIKNPLNFVNNFSVVSSELIDELQETLKGISFDDKARTEIKELTDTLRGNLDKVVQHGKRADAIVKNMLLHSREGSGEHRVVDINVIVEESLSLAWHGARAEKQGFNIALERSFDPVAGEADLYPQDITRVLLNLISNGFHAATHRKMESDGGNYVPTLAASTKSLGDRVEIRIRDNGTGIPPEVKEKMFNPFFTTKPAGEGTGLGLSICHDIIVKQHGGSIEIETQPHEFTEIRVILPRVAALIS